MKFIIKGSKQITLPVTPDCFEVSCGRRIETVNIHEMGDINLPGGMALGTIKISCMFPKQDYPFASDWGDPYDYVEQFERMIQKKNPVRFIVSGTGVNERVLLEGISYGERDGTGDVYATLTMRGYREVASSQTAAVGAIIPTIAPVAPIAQTAANLPRSSEQSPETEQTHTFVRGTSLYEITRMVYGSSDAVMRLAAYNGIGAANMELGQDTKIKVPPPSRLGKASRPGVIK